MFSSDNVLDNFKDRLNGNKSEREVRKANSKKIKEHFSKLYSKDHVKIKWDEYLGCSCPCSPGYRVTVERDWRIYTPGVYFVTGEINNPENDIKPKKNY